MRSFTFGEISIEIDDRQNITIRGGNIVVTGKVDTLKDKYGVDLLTTEEDIGEETIDIDGEEFTVSKGVANYYKKLRLVVSNAADMMKPTDAKTASVPPKELTVERTYSRNPRSNANIHALMAEMHMSGNMSVYSYLVEFEESIIRRVEDHYFPPNTGS